jgi:hypothetical protein
MTVRREPRQRDNAEDGTRRTPRATNGRHDSWNGLEEILPDDPNRILKWVIDRYGMKLTAYLNALVRGWRRHDALDPIFNDALFGTVNWISAGLRKAPDELMAKPLGQLVLTQANRACGNWWRRESAWYKHHETIGDSSLEPVTRLNGSAGHRPRGSVKRRNGEELVERGNGSFFGSVADVGWEQFERDQQAIYTTLNFNQHERKVFTARTRLKREFEDEGKRFPKKQSVSLVMQKITATTGEVVSKPYVKRWLSSGNKKLDGYLRLQARTLRQEPGGLNGRDQEGKRKRPGTPSGDKRPGRLRPPKGGGGQ